VLFDVDGNDVYKKMNFKLSFINKNNRSEAKGYRVMIKADIVTPQILILKFNFGVKGCAFWCILQAGSCCYFVLSSYAMHWL